MAGLGRIALALALVLSFLWAGALAVGVMEAARSTCGGGVLGRQCAATEDVGGGQLRRSLEARKPTNRYISYAALKADQVPCNKRNRSYYTNCESQKPENPYNRGCSAITRCSRNMS